ncbi:hypothetical protein W911_00220 [Hyphomicrobium nitrativorans NL23]|uniref:Uncharacterized protein n=1 Tax=Hyphomicrobium nitrativorans NL23 TaxID=1029756 RepID=V5SH01_9HYPH|nr:hypothetical protein W911_00220 [Hyphomicrobium nitrativorans NL23]
MTSKDPRAPSHSAAKKEERLAKALRDNLARRKALQRAKRTHDDAPSETSTASSPAPARKDEPHA